MLKVHDRGGRPIGSHTVYNKKKLHDALAERGFDVALQIEKICSSTTISDDAKAKFILGLLEFLYPKVRDPDMIQNNFMMNPANLSTQELAQIARGEVIDP